MVRQLPNGKPETKDKIFDKIKNSEEDLSRNLKYRRLLRISDKLYRKPTQSLKNEKYLSHCYVPRGKDEPVAFPYCVKWG